MTSLKKIARITIVILALFIMIFSGSVFFRILHGYYTGDHSYEALRDHVHISDNSGSSMTAPDPSGAEDLNIEIPFPIVDFTSLRKINPDIVAWIQIPGTAIDYPIVYGADNDYYLNHLIDGTPNRCGSFFLDCRSTADLSDRHTLIHGHNMGNGTMFQDLVLYKSQEFFNEHPFGYLLTPDENYVIEFFAGSLLSQDSDVWQLDFSGDSAFRRWIDSCLSSARVTGSLTPSVGDQIVTLSTCSYEFYEARWVLQGLLRTRVELMPTP